MSVCDTIASKFFVSQWVLAAVTFGFSRASFCLIFVEAPVGFKKGRIERFFVGSDPFPDLHFEVTDRDLDLREDLVLTISVSST